MKLQPSAKLFAQCYPEWTRDVARSILSAPVGATFGVYGPWGAGKSSACGALAEAMYAHAHEAGKVIQIVPLNAYALRHAPEQAAREALNAELEHPLRPMATDAKSIRAVFGLVSKFVAPIVSATTGPAGAIAGPTLKVLGDIGLSVVDTRIEEESKRVVTDLALDKLIVIIDDLDRCTPKDALFVLAQCADPVAARAANVIIACDPEILAAHVSAAFGVARTAGLEAISKYVHVPIYLPTGHTAGHERIFHDQIRSTIPEIKASMVEATAASTGVIPIREILSALPQATLWAERICSLHDVNRAVELTKPIFFAAVLAIILPEVVRVAQASPGSFYMLSDLVRSGPSKEKRELGDVIAVFGNTVVDALRTRPDLIALGRRLIPDWDGPAGKANARDLAYLIGAYSAAPLEVA